MKTKDFTTTIIVDRSPEEVFKAIQNVKGWWSEEIEGKTANEGDIFKYHYEDVHRCKVKLTEVIPNQKIVWLIEENYFSFTEDDTEWTNTTAVFDISKEDHKTKLTFTHVGLVPEYECFDVCTKGWSNYIENSLKKLIETGKGQPNANGKPQIETERALSSKE